MCSDLRTRVGALVGRAEMSGEVRSGRGGSIRPGFYNDCLLAVTAWSHGHVIVSHNRRDFDLSARVEPGVSTAAPFP